jgi:hypothetical protein
VNLATDGSFSIQRNMNITVRTGPDTKVRDIRLYENPENPQFEGDDESVRRGIMFSILEDPLHLPSDATDLVGLPSIQWCFWNVVRDP